MLQQNPIIGCIRLLAFVSLLSFVPHVAALEWGPVGGPDNYDPARHNPFAQDPNFIAPTLDLSGVGQFHKPETNNYFWATMISDTYFLTARHILGEYQDYEVHFYHDNDPTPAESIPIDETYLTLFGDNSNLLLGRLQSAPSSAVKRYPLIKRPEGTNYAGIDDIDLKLYLVGVHNATLEYGEAQSRIGLNDISQHYGDHFYFDYDFGQHGVDEARTLCCDSSAPSLVANPYAGFALAGIHHGDDSDFSISPLASAIAAEVHSASGGTESATIVSDLAGDVNADFRVDISDRTILLNNLGNGPGMRHIDGDINGDGYVNNDDLMALDQDFNKTLSAPADFNADFAVNKVDMLVIGNHWHSVGAAHADGDANGDGYVDGKDFDLLNASYLSVPWTAPHAISPVPGDLTADGLVDNDDSNIVLACMTSTCSPQDFQRADINNDSLVDATDLQILLSNWDPNGPADVNNDLKINNVDIAVLFRNWGTTTNLGKADGDLNLDGVVDANDYQIMTDWWGRGVSDFAAQSPLGSIPLPGDFNADGVVNAADYLVWRKNEGTTNTMPNDSIGGTIGQAQYDLWRSHFGQTVGSGSGVGALVSVPEPTALIMLLTGILALCSRRCSKAS